MTIQSQTRTAGPFVGSGAVVPYPFNFKVFQPTDLMVVRGNPDGSETTLTMAAEYNVTLNSDQETAPGGIVQLTTGLPSGYSLMVTSSIPEIQKVLLTNQGGFYPRVISDALDYLTILIQQLRGPVNRSLKLPFSDSGMSATLPSATDRANTLLGFDSVGRPIVTVPGSESATGVGLALASYISSNGMYLTNSVEKTVNSISELRAMSKTANTKARTLGYYAAGDGGDGVYYYDAADASTPDNGGTVIVAADGGRWKLMPGPFSVKQFGARGNDTANDDGAFTRCFAAGATYTGGCEILIPTGRYLLKNTIFWDQRRVRVTCGKSAILNFSTATTDDMWALQYIGTDLVESGDFNTWTGGEFLGPPASTGVNGLRVAAPGTDSSGSFVSYVRVSITGFDKQIGLGDHVSFCNFIEMKMRTLGGPNYQTETGICIIGVNNMGEAITFTSPQLGGLRYGILNDFGGVADGLIFIAPGIDYCKQAIVLTAPIGINLTGGHFECQDMALPAFVANGNGCVIEWERAAMWVLHNPINGFIAKATNVTLGGIFFRSPFFQFPSGFGPAAPSLTDPASDPGSVRWSDVRTYAGQEHSPAGVTQSESPYFTNDARFAMLCTSTDAGDGSTIALDSAVQYRGLATTRLFTNTAGAQIKRVIKIPVPSHYGIPAFSLHIRADGFTVSRWSVAVTLYDERDTLVAGFGSYDNLGNTGGFQMFKWYLQGRTHGAAYVAFNIYAGGQDATETQRLLNIADCVVNIL